MFAFSLKQTKSSANNPLFQILGVPLTSDDHG